MKSYPVMMNAVSEILRNKHPVTLYKHKVLRFFFCVSNRLFSLTKFILYFSLNNGIEPVNILNTEQGHSLSNFAGIN